MISVVIPVYNAEKFVERAVESALVQPEVSQIILIEDGSPDNALEKCKDLETKHEKVHLFRHPEKDNQGAGASRNLGIKKATSEFVSFLDADDYYLEKRFEKTMTVFKDHSDAQGVYECVGTDFSSEKKKNEWLENGRDLFTTIKNLIAPQNLLEALTVGNQGYFHLNGLTVRRNVFETTGYFDTDLKRNQDTEMSIRLSAICRLYPGKLSEPVANRYWHEENRAGKWNDQSRKYWKMCAKKLLVWSGKNLKNRKRELVFLYSERMFSLALELKDKGLGLIGKRLQLMKLYLSMMCFNGFYFDKYLFFGLLGVISMKFKRRFGADQALNIVEDDVFAVIKKGSCCIDCGANIGDITSRMVDKGAEVYSFEPNPHAFSELLKRFKDNETVHCINKGVWDKNGSFKLYLHQNSDESEVKWSTGSSLLGCKGNIRKDKYVDVEIIDLIEFIKNLNRRIALLKIDVEGAECEILDRIISEDVYKEIDRIVVETHDHKVPELKKSTDLIRKMIRDKNIDNISLDWI